MASSVKKRCKGSNSTILLVALTVLLTTSGCGGGMLNVKQAFDSNPKAVVMEFPVKTDYLADSVIDLRVPARSTLNPESRAPETCRSSCIIETKPLTADYRDIAKAIHAELRTGLGRSDLKFGTWNEVPSKTAALGMKGPDWSKTGYDIIIWPNITVEYDETALPPMKRDASMRYSYKLKGSVNLMIWRKNAKGDLELVRPSMSGYVYLADVSRSVGDPSVVPLGITVLEQLMPSSTILSELREKSLEGVRRFVKEMKEAK